MQLAPLVAFDVFTIGAILIGARYARATTVIIVSLAILFGTYALLNLTPISSILAAATGAVLECGALALWWARARTAIRRWRDEAAGDALALQPPFCGHWRVVAGGPLPGKNHHLVASDQRFAYDFVRVGGPSFDEPILAPCTGEVVAAVDGMEDLPPSRNPNRPNVRGRELGNHVAIRSGATTVFLCHLRHGSVAVEVGAQVNAGRPIGRCGNSGRTTRAHLHLHAQDRPVYALWVAGGVPVAFVDATGRAQVPDYGTVVAGPPAPAADVTATGL